MPRLPRRLGYGDRITLIEHLDELRKRLVISLVFVSIAFGVCYGFRHTILGWLLEPLDGKKPITLGVAEAFTTSLSVSLYAAIAITLPFLLWQLWSFLAPAIDEHRQRTVAQLGVAGGVLLASGMAFAYWVVLPRAISFLTSFDTELYQNEIRARSYFTFVALTILATGLLFELPVILLGLVRMGVLTAKRLRANRRIGIGVLVALSMALPGVDPVTSTLQTIPLLILFEASIWASVFFERRWQAQAEAAALADQDDEPPFDDDWSGPSGDDDLPPDEPEPEPEPAPVQDEEPDVLEEPPVRGL